MASEPRNQFSLTRVASCASGPAKNRFPIQRACRQGVVRLAGCSGVLALTVLWISSAVAQNLFVSNLGTGSVWEYSPSGSLITSTFASGLDSPQGITFDRSGNLYVAYGGNNGRVAKYGPSGTLINPSFISGLGVLSGLAFDSGGNLYVANMGYLRIAKYGPSGNLINANFASGSYPGFYAFWGMAFDRSDNLYVSDTQDRIVAKISPSGSVNTSFLTGLDYPTGLTFDQNNNLYVANYYTGKIAKYDTSGNVINAAFASTGQGYNIESLAFDYRGNLYVGNNGNGAIWEFGPSGNLITSTFASGGSGAEYIAFPVAIPEPSAWALLGLGLPPLMALRRRMLST